MSMDGSTNAEGLQIKSSRSGHPVPCLNGVLLHSIYNPIKESESLLEKHRAQLQQKNSFLILGLGFGYHVNAIHQYASKFTSSDKLNICVLEPNQDLVKAFFEFLPDNTNTSDLAKNSISRENKYRIFVARDIRQLYSNKDFLDFLTLRPSLIPHPASFNLHQGYFKEFLSFESTNKFQDIASDITNSKFKTYLENQSPDTEFNEFINTLKLKKSNLTKEDYLFLALDKCSRGIEVNS